MSWNAASLAPGLQKHPVRIEIPAAAVVPRDGALVDDAAAGIEQVEGDGAAAVAGAGGPVDPRHRLAVAVAQRSEPVEEPAGQAHHPLVDQVDPDAVDPGQPGLQIGYLQEAERAVLEPGLARGQRVPVALHAGQVHRPAGEPGTPQPPQRLPPRDQAADAGRVAEHLVPADRHEIGLDHGQVQPVRRHVGGRVQQDVVAMLVRRLYPAQRMLHPAEVALRRVGQQPAAAGGGRSDARPPRPVPSRPATAAAGRASPAQGATRARHPPGRAQRPGLGWPVPGDRVVVDPQLGRAERHVLRDRAARPGELPDAVDRVVIVLRQDQPGPRAERVGLPDQPARAGGVRGEDGRVLLGRRVEVREDREPGPLDQFGRRGGGRVFRVRVPEAPAAHPLGVRGQLRLRPAGPRRRSRGRRARPRRGRSTRSPAAGPAAPCSGSRDRRTGSRPALAAGRSRRCRAGRTVRAGFWS